MTYTITVENIGDAATDTDSIVLIDRLPGEVEFWNGDLDTGGPDTFAGTDPLGFVQQDGAALNFTYASDVAFSTSATPPTDFSDCAFIAPDNTYRDDINFVCINPKGQLAAGNPDPNFAVTFRARIK